MPRRGTPLSDIEIKQAKAGDKPSFLYDTGGLYLQISPSGSKLWRLKYRFLGKEYRLGLGKYPAVSLKQARLDRDKLHAMIAQGVDPGEKRREAKIAQVRSGATFESVAREWVSKHSPVWSATHLQTVVSRLERDLIPTLGAIPIGEVTAGELLEALRAVECRGSLETAKRELAICGQIWKYALATGKAIQDVTYQLKGALPPHRKGNFAAVTDPQRLGEVLRLIYAYQGHPSVMSALKLAPHLAVRPGELRNMKWCDIHWETAQWEYLVSKTETPHIVPLSPQVQGILRGMMLVTGRYELVFTNTRSTTRPLSDATLTAALRALGLSGDEVTVHGFRASFRTMADEILGYRPEIIELQLAHTVRDPLGRSYNRTQFIQERHRLMRDWSNYLDELMQ